MEAEGKSDVTVELFGIRSLLFLPASNARAIAKARTAGADLVILDLEDSVKPEDKAVARQSAVEAAAAPWPVPLAIRVNRVGTSWHSEDMAAVAVSKADLAVLPDIRSPDEAGTVWGKMGKPLIGMIESAAGVIAAVEIARDCSALLVGTNDLANDLRLPPSSDRGGLQSALQLVVLAARAAGIPVFDGVFNALDDEAGLTAECQQGRAWGFDGKSLIHPAQVEPCHRAFAPTAQELARAERLVTAATGGAERFEGQMIERMHVEAARRLLNRPRG